MPTSNSRNGTKPAADFGKAIDQWPDGPAEGWYWARVVAFAQLNQPDRAIADLQQAITKGFDNAETDERTIRGSTRSAPAKTLTNCWKSLERKEKLQSKQKRPVRAPYRQASSSPARHLRGRSGLRAHGAMTF